MGAPQPTVSAQVRGLLGKMPVGYRVEVLTDLLREIAETKHTPEARQALLRLLPAKSDVPVPAQRSPKAYLKLAEEILSTLMVDNNGFDTLTIPPKVSDVEALRALNKYCQRRFKEAEHPAISLDELSSYEFGERVMPHDISKERKIRISMVFMSELGDTDLQKPKVLKNLEARGKILGSPKEVTLLLAARFCKNEGRGYYRDPSAPTEMVFDMALTSTHLTGVLAKSGLRRTSYYQDPGYDSPDYGLEYRTGGWMNTSGRRIGLR